ncbi:MAG: hypothetical protein R2764_05490 [Bacteroidales bacterium]
MPGFNYISKPTLSIRAIHSILIINFVQYSIALNIGLGKHNIYLGPEYNIILDPIKGDPVDVYEKYNWGLNFGYRYYSNELFKKMKLFGQFNFSIYQLKYKSHSLGNPIAENQKDAIVENTASIGLNYNMYKSFNIFLGAGFGSYDGFFLILESFTPSIYVGVDYRF